MAKALRTDDVEQKRKLAFGIMGVGERDDGARIIVAAVRVMIRG